MSRTAHHLVVDLEATCSDTGEVPRTEMEIIEIGAVLVAEEDSGFSRIGEFQTFVRPVRHPRLTTFCTNLTTIQQSDVDTASTFPDAVQQLKSWLYREPRELTFCSWGDYDRKQFTQDCAFHAIPNPMPGRHINLKREFARVQRLSKKPGLSQAIAMTGFSFDGTPHRAISDARNILQLLPFIFGGTRVPVRSD